ncbi:MAG: hypothetical protein ACI8T1_003706 [Verrucomicrobiales bacterium]|jgi:hypothetical protein
MKTDAMIRTLVAGLIAATSWQSFAAEILEIEATEAFYITSNASTRHDTDRMLAGGWPDNAGWGLMRGIMAFDLSTIPKNSGIASASVTLNTRSTGFSVTNPEGAPGYMAIKDLGNLEADPNFDVAVVTWDTLDPLGGDVSGPALSTYARSDFQDGPADKTPLAFTTNAETFAAAISRALEAGQSSLYLMVHCPDFDANPVNGKHFYRLKGANEKLPVMQVTVLGADSDSDGLEDDWELGFFPGDLTKLSSSADNDGDGLNDKGEFLAGADPTNPDTDNDTISDGAEVVSFRTDPTLTDSDGDGLADNDEIEEDPFITNPAAADTDRDGLNDGDEVTLGTDPSNPDTDGDTYADGLEKDFSSDPTDPSSVTGSLVRGGQWKVEMAISDSAPSSTEEVIALLDNGAGRVGEVQTTEWGVINFQITTSVDAFFDTLTTYPILDNPVARPIGMRVSGGIFVREAGLVTVGYDSRGATPGVLVIDGQTVELTPGTGHNSGRGPNLVSMQLDAGPHDVVFYHWLNADTGVYLFSSLQNGQKDDWDATQMELMPAFDIANVMTEDSDGDGLDDFWENFYFGNLASDGSGDQDGDGLTDQAESENRANPTKKDTDGDGLEDGPEVAEHLTAPNLFDSDGDAIGDGAEVTEHQTDPNKRDTDDDNIADNVEITLGSNPTDANSIPDTVVLLRDQSTGRSWQDGSFWSDGEPASADRAYQVGGVPGLGTTLRSPTGSDPGFPGASLTLEDGSTLRLKHSGQAAFPAITAKNAIIQQGQAGQTIGMAADIAVNESLAFDIQGENRQLDLEGHLSGSGTLTLGGVLGGVLSINAPASDFAGDISIDDITVINAAPGSIRGNNVRLSGELLSDSVVNLAGKRLTLIGSEVKVQLDQDIYVSELYFQPDREQENEFNLDGLLGAPKSTAVSADWFGDPNLGSLNELVVTNLPDGETPTGRVIYSADADNDGLPDVWEGENGLDAAVDDAQGDGDSDGLTNELEFYLATALDNTDSDGDGLEDGAEFNTHGSSPSSKDSDGDGLEDGAEVNEYNTSPSLVDTDADGLTDSDEINTHLTDPTKADTDGDGVHDSLEIANGVDPLDAASTVAVWSVRTVSASNALNNLDQAEAALAGTGVVAEVNSQHVTINFAPDGGGNYDNDEIFPHMTAIGQDLNDFSIEVTGRFTVDTAGTYTFGFNTDDGGSLAVNGTEVVSFPGTRGADDSLGTVELTAGDHDLRFVMFERGGGSAAELFISTAPGELTEFDNGQFKLLTAAALSETPPVDPVGEPVLTSVERTANGVAIGIPEGETYDIEYSTDLLDWTSIAKSQSGTFEDTEAARTGDAAGFYRGARH